jgi:hypothetical protein|tara:strand:- start:4739 stop:5473 length:735 start_codon:yes stop_codon:yes gene_type:complete
MIQKTLLQSLINKYHLGIVESVKWEIKDNILSIDFMTPTRDVIGNVTCNDFELEDSNLAIYDTKKLSSLVNICQGNLILELDKLNQLYTKLKISDINFNLNYALSDPLLIGKVGTVNVPEFVVELDLELEHVENLIRAKSALSQVDNMLITVGQNPDGEKMCEFIFGDESGHNNKITYQIPGKINIDEMKLPFNSDVFKTLLYANKDMEEGKLRISQEGLMKIDFKTENVYSNYYMVRKAETDY